MLRRMLSVWSNGWFDPGFDPERRQINSWTDSISMVAALVPLLHDREELPIIIHAIFKNKTSSMDLHLLPS